MIIYALRSKKSGRYFQWYEYADDGWGKYEDTISHVNDPDDLPQFFTHFELFEAHKQFDKADKKDLIPFSQLKDHTIDEVEIIEFELVQKSP